MEEQLRSLRDRVAELWDVPAVRAIVIVAGALIAARVIEVVIRKTILRLVRRTETTLDDLIVDAIRRPIFLTIVLIGLHRAADELALGPSAHAITDSVIETLAVLIWMSAAFKIGVAVLETVSRRAGSASVIQPRTLPVFEMILKLAIVGTAIYFLFLAWQIDLTAWLASAGIIGIAVGFAAKDTLANLFSGIFIVADAPYKLGDFILLEGGLRGQVTRIGIRSTRVLTLDDVEITVPNAVIGNSTIVNETGGASVRSRIKVEVDVAYGSDIDRVRELLLECPDGVGHLAADPPPEVRFTEFGASGLHFELLVWLELPARRGHVIDALHCAIYKSFTAAGIEIPYPKQDLYIKEVPGPGIR